MVTVQFIHRCFAWLIATLILALWLKSLKSQTIPALHAKAIQAVLFFLLLQAGLGIFTLLSAVNPILAVMHQAGAFFLFASLLVLRQRLKIS